MTRLNLGCGPDIRADYVNVDAFAQVPNVTCVDLTNFPWPWQSNSVDEILMLDLLEHFPYRLTSRVLQECHRVLKINGRLEVQVPDFEHCALAMLDAGDYLCNVCGANNSTFVSLNRGSTLCQSCGTSVELIAEAAMNRLYGGQNVEGNWHFAAFTKSTLTQKLLATGFKDISELEKSHQWANWNFKLEAKKDSNVW